MELKGKLEILNALTNDDFWFPRNKVYRDNSSLIATNGIQMLAFHFSENETPDLESFTTLDVGAEASRQLARKDKTSDTPNMIRRWLTQDAETWTIDLRGLLEFLGVEEYRRCPMCCGSGHRPINENFEYVLLNDPFEKGRIADIGGALTNGNLLISVLAHLPASETISLSTWLEHGYVQEGKKEGRILRLVGEGWTLIQMSLMSVDGVVEVFQLAEAA